MLPDLENGDTPRRQRFKPFLQNLVKLMYRRIFHEEISPDVMAFLKNLLYIGIGTAISSLLFTVFTILGGRILGPEEYGKFVLVQTVAMFLYIPMLLGFSTAMLKYSSEKADMERRICIVSTTYILVFIFTLVSAITFTIFRNKLSELFSISPELFSISLIFSILFVFYTLTTSVLRGQDKTRAYAILQVIFSFIILLLFLFFVINRSISFKSMTYPMLFAYGISNLAITIIFLRNSFKWRFNLSWVKVLSKYAVYSVIGGLSVVFGTYFGKIMISQFMNIGDLGIYSAYYAASINVIGLFSGIFSIAFFPTVSKYENKREIFKKINKFIPHLIWVGLPFVIICEYIILKIYGSQYPLNLFWMVLFAVASLSIVVDGLYGWLLNSEGTKGAKISSLGAVTLAIINIGLNIILIPLIGLSGVVLSLIVSYAASISVMLFFGKKYMNN